MSGQVTVEDSKQRFMIYFVVPSYNDQYETEERTIIVANDRTEAIEKFKEQLPGAYINDIYHVEA